MGRSFFLAGPYYEVTPESYYHIDLPPLRMTNVVIDISRENIAFDIDTGTDYWPEYCESMVDISGSFDAKVEEPFIDSIAKGMTFHLSQLLRGIYGTALITSYQFIYRDWYPPASKNVPREELKMMVDVHCQFTTIGKIAIDLDECRQSKDSLLLVNE